jgi:sugar (pentulose or hexulose) kinase
MNQAETARKDILEGRALLGIELGSTRIKAVLLGPDHHPLASGDHRWENQLSDGVWTYDLGEVFLGLQAAYQALAASVTQEYGVPLRKLAGIGVSAMMHGYLAFNAAGKLLVPFRTWRNTMTGEAAKQLSELMDFSIPQRWSVAHLFQAILNGEPHVPNIRFLTTLSGYVHWQLTGQKVLGVGDASGMFPIGANGGYDAGKMSLFRDLVYSKGYPWTLESLLPEIRLAGDEAGRLTKEGASLLDPSGLLEPGIPLCPPEGDAGTGMVATNAVAPRTGNVSAGTSIFAMIVLEKELSRIHPEIDIVTTPAGKPVAMVHCNNCTTDLNAWVSLFLDFAKAAGLPLDRDRAYAAFFDQALLGDSDAGGLISCGYYSGEHITGFTQGQPLLVHPPQSSFTFANLARSVLFSALTTLKIGMEVLEGESVGIDRIMGHGGLFKKGDAGQRLTAAALRAPVSVMETAGEGGAWGAGLLAAYMAGKETGESLSAYLDRKVFKEMAGARVLPDSKDVQGFDTYLERFKAILEVERAAVAHL